MKIHGCTYVQLVKETQICVSLWEDQLPCLSNRELGSSSEILSWG